jgi:hypothetical protein
MVVRHPLHRSAAVLAAAALALGAAGCGGSDGGDSGGGDQAYASTWNEVCTSLSTAQTTLQSEGARVQKSLRSPTPEALAKAFAKPVTAFADSMTAALDRVKDLDAPDEFRTFQDQVAKSAPSTITVLRNLKEPLAKGDVQAAQSVVGRIDQKNVFPAIPASLKKQATACSVF